MEKENQLENEVKDMIASAENHNDLDAIGKKIKYFMDNQIYEVNIIDLQIGASRKMREIYNKIGEPRYN